MRQIIIFLVLLTLTGCIGSYIVHDDTSGHDYGNLATVPDRPQPSQIETYHQEIDRLEVEHKKAVHQNEEFRQLHQKIGKSPE